MTHGFLLATQVYMHDGRTGVIGTFSLGRHLPWGDWHRVLQRVGQHAGQGAGEYGFLQVFPACCWFVGLFQALDVELTSSQFFHDFAVPGFALSQPGYPAPRARARSRAGRLSRRAR